jgi:hypothetical protein
MKAETTRRLLLPAWASALRMVWTRQRCQVAFISLATAALMPSWASVDGGLNPRLSGGGVKTGTSFAMKSWRAESGAIDPCQRRKPPEAVAKGQRLQGSIAR